MKLFSNSNILNLWLALVLVFSSMIYAQTPGIPYQAYIEDTNAGYVPGEQLKNIPLSHTNIMLEFTILDDTDSEEYTVTKSVTTDAYGLVSTIVGIDGTVTYGSFSGITWDGTKKTLRTRIDFTNTGNNFEDHGEIVLYYMPSPSETVTQGLSSATGAPTATSPADAEAGDIYVDDATGDIYTHDGTGWVKNSGSDTGTGAPSATSPADPEAGDLYVDDATGDIYTYDGTEWIAQSEVVSTDADNLVKEGTDGLAFMSESAIQDASGTTTATGAPSSTSPADPEAGDIYVDDATGDIYTYDGSEWIAQSEVVSTDADNLVKEGTDGLAFLDESAIQDASGTTTATGAPTATDPADPEAGDLYVDDATGDIYTYDGSEWIAQSEVVSTDADNLVKEGTDGLAFLDESAIQDASGTTTATGAPTATDPADPEAGDLYVDDATGDIYTYDGSEWIAQSEVVSTDTGNIIKEDTDGLAFLDESAIQDASGTTTATGAPTATDPADPEAGDLYVDDATGDIYTYDGTEWIAQSEVVSTDTGNIIKEDTDGLAFLDESAIQDASGTTTATGAPTATDPADPEAGDLYVDDATGDIYTYDGSEWIAQSEVVSTDTGNIIEEDTDGLAFLDESAIQDASGTTTGTGAPTATDPADPEAGDLYVDDATGDIYTYDGTEWIAQSEVVSADTGNIIEEDTDGLAFLDESAIQDASGTTTGTGAPTATDPADPEAGDLYVDETTGDIYTYNSTDDAWEKQISDADNGLTNNSGTVELGGALTKVTEIETSDTKTLAITGLQDADDTKPEDYTFLAIDKTTGVIYKTASTAPAKQLVVSYTAARGDDEFDTPKNILELDNVDAYRNGVRIDFVQVDANTIKLDLAEINGCYTGDEIRIVQLQ